MELWNTVRELKEIGVKVRFEKENINSISGDDELMLSILDFFAQEESRSIVHGIKEKDLHMVKYTYPLKDF